MKPDKNDIEEKPKLSDEQLAENQRKMDEYYRYFKIFLVALAMTFAVIVGIAVVLVIQNS